MDHAADRPAMMRLHSTITSPYARKVWVAAREMGLIDRIEWIATNPHADEYLRGDNPLCRVPTLVFEDGETLFDSLVICEYLDSLHAGVPFFPQRGPARWQALRLQALGDGMLDANVSRRMEVIRPAQKQSPGWIARQILGVTTACQRLETHLDQLAGPMTIGHIAVGCALSYFETRFPSDPWRADTPGLAAWHAGFAARPSMQATSYAALKATLPAVLIKEGPSAH